MKRRMVSFGVAATHDLITPIASFGDIRSFSDFDALVLDPFSLVNPSAIGRPEFERRQREISDLINRKGGIVICLLRPDQRITVAVLGNLSCYSLFEQATYPVTKFIEGRVRSGLAERCELNGSAINVVNRYSSVLHGALRSEAFLDTTTAEVEALGGKVCAKNSAEYPVCVEFVVGPGRLCFLPVVAATFQPIELVRP
jgi:hypothetical protein